MTDSVHSAADITVDLTADFTVDIADDVTTCGHEGGAITVRSERKTEATDTTAEETDRGGTNRLD
jgi:hypothetical protein